MSDRTKPGFAKLSDLAYITPEAYQKYEERLWKSYGSKENWEEVKAMTKQIARQEIQIEKLQAQVDQLQEQNMVLLGEFVRLTKGRVN